MNWIGLPLVIYGSKGTSKETYEIVTRINKHNNSNVFDFQGFVENDHSKIGEEVIGGYKVIACDSNFKSFSEGFKILGVAIPLGIPNIKKNIYKKISENENLVYPNIIHPGVDFNQEFSSLGYGNIITSGVNFTCDIKVGNFNLFNPNVTIGHDTVIGDFNVINPLASVSGNVKIKDGCLIGTGANILQRLTLEKNVTVGAGAVVIGNVKEGTTVIGVPAKLIEKGGEKNGE